MKIMSISVPKKIGRRSTWYTQIKTKIMLIMKISVPNLRKSWKSYPSASQTKNHEDPENQRPNNMCGIVGMFAFGENAQRADEPKKQGFTFLSTSGSSIAWATVPAMSWKMFANRPISSITVGSCACSNVGAERSPDICWIWPCGGKNI